MQLINKGALGTKFKLMTMEEYEKSKEPQKDPSVDSENPPVTNEIDPENHEIKFEELKIGGIKEGPIGPFSTVDLEFVFFPTFPGKYNEQFVIQFEDEDSKEV
jgi:hypothetical protein